MTVIIDEKSALMSAEYSGARPGVGYLKGPTKEFAALHQGRHSGPFLTGKASKATPTEKSAIKLTATVDVQADRRDDIQRTYEFHLMQFVWKPIDYALYAGTAPEGSVKVDFATPPHDSAVLLDADETGTNFPFFEDSTKILSGKSRSTWQVLLESDDHPYTERPLRYLNFVTAKTNFLYEVSRSIYFCSAFVYKDLTAPGAPIKPLGFIFWKTWVLAQIRWRGDTLKPQTAHVIRSIFTADDYLPGSPLGDFEKIMKNPPDDPSKTANAIERANLDAVFESPNPSSSPLVKASRTRDASVPADIF
jgi:hypothetical protein